MKKRILIEDDRIFIAGASGMVGSAIKRKLIDQKLSSKNTFILAPGRNELDLTNNDEVKNWFKKNKPSIVIIAAAKVGGILANSTQPADFLLENIKIQTNIIENSWLNNVRRLVFLGSSCIYPKFAKQPIKEEYLLDGPLEVTNDCYAIAKIAGIKLCQALNTQYGFDAISLMPTNLYGPGDNYHIENSHVMASLIRKFCEAVEINAQKVSCWGDGTPLREFMHVDDLASAVLFVLNNWYPQQDNSPKDSSGNKLYYLNVGTGLDISIKELANMISKLTDYKGQIEWDTNKPNGTPKKQLDVTKIKNLGWRPQIKLKDGIKSVIKDYRKNKNIYK